MPITKIYSILKTAPQYCGTVLKIRGSPACSAIAQQLRAGLTGPHVMYYIYVLKSKRDGKLYVGWTDDLRNRFFRHQSGLVQSTKNRRPLQLIYYEACLVKEDAIKREKSLKTGYGRSYLNRRLSNIKI